MEKEGAEQADEPHPRHVLRGRDRRAGGGRVHPQRADPAGRDLRRRPALCSASLPCCSCSPRFPRVHPEPEPGARAGLRLLRQPLLLIMTAALLVYVGTEIGISSWASEYVVKVLGVSASTAAFAVALFWRGCWPGRLAISFGYKGTRQELVMLGLSVLSGVALAVVLLVRSTAGRGRGDLHRRPGQLGVLPAGHVADGKVFQERRCGRHRGHRRRGRLHRVSFPHGPSRAGRGDHGAVSGSTSG